MYVCVCVKCNIGTYLSNFKRVFLKRAFPNTDTVQCQCHSGTYLNKVVKSVILNVILTPPVSLGVILKVILTPQVSLWCDIKGNIDTAGVTL